MALLYVKENTTVGELKSFLSKIPDESKIYAQDHGTAINIRFDDYQKDENEHELYIEHV